MAWGQRIRSCSAGSTFLAVACLLLVIWIIAGNTNIETLVLQSSGNPLLWSSKGSASFLQGLQNNSTQCDYDNSKGFLRSENVEADSSRNRSKAARDDSKTPKEVCGCSELLGSGLALQGLSVGQKRCIAVNLSSETSGAPLAKYRLVPGLDSTRPVWSHNLQQWQKGSTRRSVLVILRGPNSARAFKLEQRDLDGKCFTGDVIAPREGLYAIEVLARVEGGAEEGGLKNQAVLLTEPFAVTATVPPEAETVDETYDPAPKLCPPFTTVDQLSDGQGFWVPCSDAPYVRNCSDVLTDGWIFLRPDCHYPLYEREPLIASLKNFAESAPNRPGTRGKKLAVLVLGDSRTRGLFLEVASRVMSAEAAANLTRSEYGKVWGIIHFETPTISMTWRDLRGYSTPCPTKAEAYLWPDGVTLGFERVEKCLARQAEVRDDLARLVGRVKPDLVYAQNGFALLDSILAPAPWVTKIGLLGWVQMSERLGMVSDNVNWAAVETGVWGRFNTLDIELPLYRELCNEHRTSVYDIHMHAFCGTRGERLCGIVNQMTSQILIHDVIERLTEIADLRRAHKDASWPGPTDAIGGDSESEILLEMSASNKPGSVRNEPDALHACQAGTDHFEIEYTLGLLDKLVCKNSMVRVNEFRTESQLTCSNYTILNEMATLQPHRWMWQL